MEITIWRSLIEACQEDGRGLWYDPARKFVYLASQPFERGHDLLMLGHRLLPFVPETDADIDPDVRLRVEVIDGASETADRIWQDPDVDVVAIRRGQHSRRFWAFGRLAHHARRWLLDPLPYGTEAL